MDDHNLFRLLIIYSSRPIYLTSIRSITFTLMVIKKRTVVNIQIQSTYDTRSRTLSQPLHVVKYDPLTVHQSKLFKKNQFLWLFRNFEVESRYYTSLRYTTDVLQETIPKNVIPISKTISVNRFYKILVNEPTTEVKAGRIGAPSVKKIDCTVWIFESPL